MWCHSSFGRFVAPAIVLATVLGAGHGEVWARPNNGRDWFGHMGGGYTVPVDATRDRLDEGWNVQVGGAWFPSPGPFGVMLNASFLSLDLSDPFLARLDAHDGRMEVWPISIDALFSPRLEGRVGFYALAGIGASIVHGEVKGPIGTAPVPCDPWWWSDCEDVFTPETYPRTATETKFGMNGGLGLEFGVGSNTLYVEGRYQYVFLENEPGRFVPIAAGFRW